MSIRIRPWIKYFLSRNSRQSGDFLYRKPSGTEFFKQSPVVSYFCLSFLLNALLNAANCNSAIRSFAAFSRTK